MDEARLNLTRRFGTAGEAREEAETNLSAGSLWVPLEPGVERPALLRAVVVHLVLPDGATLEGLRGRISCVASTGAAVVLDDLPSALLLTRLLGGELPPPPFGNGDLAPEDAPPLPAGIADGWVPTPSAELDTLPSLRIDPPAAPLALEVPVAVDPGVPVAPAEPRVPVAAPPAPAAPVPSVAVPAAPQDPWALPPAAAPGVPPEAEPFALEPAPSPRLTGTIDFPVPRDVAPVAAVAPDGGMWGDIDGLEPALKEATTEFESSEPPRPMFTVRFATGAELETAWKAELGAGRVMVVAADPPPLDTRVEVTLLLPEIGALVLEGTVVHRAGAAAGIRLDIEGSTRALIESALPSYQPPVPAAEGPPTRSANVSPDGPDAAPRRPTLQFTKDSATGNAAVVLAFDSLADFRHEYETNIRRGGVMVPTAERPPVRSVIEVVFSLLGGKREVRLKGEVVLHGVAGIGVQLGEIPQTTRVEIDSLLAAAAPREQIPTPKPAPQPTAPIAPPPPASFGAPLADGPSASAPRRASEVFAPSGARFEGELVEVMREAEVEGEAGVGAKIGAKASWLKVLVVLQSTRSSGVLQAIRKAETKSYVVFQGRILDAMGDPRRDDESMLRVVRKHNLAKGGVLRVLEKSLDKAANEIEALQSSNIWTPADIDRARRWQVLERCAEVFAWEKGRFKFEPDGDRSWAQPTPGVPFGQVILHGVRSYIRASGEDLARILRPGMDRAIRIAPNTGFEPARVGMSDKELQFWAEIDGKRTLRQLLATSPIGVSATHRLVFALFRLGVLSLDRGSAPAAGVKPRESDRTEALRARAAEMKTRDVFGKLSLSWMCAPPHVQGAWDAIRRELDPDTKAGGAVAQAATEVLAIAEDAWKQLMDERTRRIHRMKLIEDPARIEAAADMLAERAEVLRMQGDAPGAESALLMALDMAPRNPAFLQLLARVRA